MAETQTTLAPGNGSATTGSPVAPPVAKLGATGEARNVPVGVPAKVSVAAFGGNATGRQSHFKFPAESPQGKEERRHFDAERKKAARAVAAKMVEPAPLPAADAVAPGAITPLVDGQNALVAFAPSPAVAPWQADMLRELTDALVDAAEEGRVEKWSGKIREARLPDRLGREIVNDARFPAPAKKGLKFSLPHAIAHGLNKTGLGSEYQHEVCCATCLAAILVQGRRLSAKLDELVEAARKSAAPKEETKPVGGPS